MVVGNAWSPNVSVPPCLADPELLPLLVLGDDPLQAASTSAPTATAADSQVPLASERARRGGLLGPGLQFRYIMPLLVLCCCRCCRLGMRASTSWIQSCMKS